MGRMIEVRDLVKNFGEFCAVDHISFGVPKGRIFGFLGPNGAGKTTTIKMLTTILKPDSGSIRVNGHDPVGEEREVRRSFGIVFQDPSLDGDLTALENLELHAVLYGVPSKERARRIEEVIKLVELWERRTEFTKNYSGGMIRYNDLMDETDSSWSVRVADACPSLWFMRKRQRCFDKLSMTTEEYDTARREARPPTRNGGEGRSTGSVLTERGYSTTASGAPREKW